jgi:hypothetical protein
MGAAPLDAAPAFVDGSLLRCNVCGDSVGAFCSCTLCLQLPDQDEPVAALCPVVGGAERAAPIVGPLVSCRALHQPTTRLRTGRSGLEEENLTLATAGAS